MTLQSVLNDFTTKIHRLNECRRLWAKTGTLLYQDDLIAFIDRLKRFHSEIYNTLINQGLLIGDVKKTVDRLTTLAQLVEMFYKFKEFTPQTKKTYRLAFADIARRSDKR